MTSDEIRFARDKILDIATSHGAHHVRIFGSAATGLSDPNSDLDLLVSLDEGRSLFDLIAIKQEVEDVVRRKVDIVTEQALSPYLRDRILSEAIPL